MSTKLLLFSMRRWLADPRISLLHSARPETRTALTIIIQREDDSHQFHFIFHIFLSAIPLIEAKIRLPHYLKWLSESIHTAGEQKQCQWHFHLLLSLHCHTLCRVLCPNPLSIPLSSLLISCLPWFVSFPFFFAWLRLIPPPIFLFCWKKKQIKIKTGGEQELQFLIFFFTLTNTLLSLCTCNGLIDR